MTVTETANETRRQEPYWLKVKFGRRCITNIGRFRYAADLLHNRTLIGAQINYESPDEKIKAHYELPFNENIDLGGHWVGLLSSHDSQTVRLQFDADTRVVNSAFHIPKCFVGSPATKLWQAVEEGFLFPPEDPEIFRERIDELADNLVRAKPHLRLRIIDLKAAFNHGDPLSALEIAREVTSAVQPQLVRQIV